MASSYLRMSSLKFHQAQIWADPEEVTVELFDLDGKPVDILAFEPEQAEDLGRWLLEAARVARGVRT